jgi:SGNH domain (fused to AT3 domains)
MVTSWAGSATAQSTAVARPSATSHSTPASTAQVLAAVAAASRIKALPSNATPPLADAQEDEGSYIASEKGCNPAANQTTLPACIYGDPSGKKTIVLFGDSHAQMWLGAFDDLAKSMNWKLVLLSKAECPAIDATVWYYPTASPYLSCDTFHTNMVKRINQLDPAVVVIANWWNGVNVSAGAQITDSQWASALTEILTSIHSHGTKKVLLGDIPYLAQSAPTCLAAHSSNIQACTTPASVAVLSDHETVLATVAKSTGALYVPVTKWFCSANCTAVIGNDVVYGDDAHITSVYAEYLWGVMKAALKPVLG